MMKYVLLVYRDVKQWQNLSASERAIFEQACQADQRDLVQRLHLLEIKDLPDSTVLAVRIVNGSVSIDEGPVAGSPEKLIQLLFIQARDLNAALQIASQMQQVQAGPIEVRPIPG